MLILLGVFSGMFIVPVQVTLQSVPPPEEKGRMIATMNQFSWVGVILGAIVYSKCIDVPSSNFVDGAQLQMWGCNNTGAQKPISNFTALSYSTYRASGTALPTFNIEVYITGSSNYTTFVFVPKAASIVNAVPPQILAYELAIRRGLDPDKPRNLAKSVTVK